MGWSIMADSPQGVLGWQHEHKTVLVAGKEKEYYYMKEHKINTPLQDLKKRPWWN